MSRYSTSSRSPGSAPLMYTGPVSGCPTLASRPARSAAVIVGRIWPSDASRVSSTTSSPGSTATIGGMSGCQRLCPRWASSLRRLLRSMLMVGTAMSLLYVKYDYLTTAIPFHAAIPSLNSSFRGRPEPCPIKPEPCLIKRKAGVNDYSSTPAAPGPGQPSPPVTTTSHPAVPASAAGGSSPPPAPAARRRWRVSPAGKRAGFPRDALPVPTSSPARWRRR